MRPARPGAIFSAFFIRVASEHAFSAIIACLSVEVTVINRVAKIASPLAEIEWVFAYGSLVWRPGFDFQHSSLAELAGWRREFSQGSPDHRGTPDYPGRVLTLRRDVSAQCVGIAYRVDDARWPSVVDYLDVRESGGYSQQIVNVSLADGISVPALTYIALPDNPHACPPESMDRLVALIQSRSGPSGSNLDYVFNLAHALMTHGIRDHAVETLADYLRSVDEANSNDCQPKAFG